jgi:hypothetical protein
MSTPKVSQMFTAPTERLTLLCSFVLQAAVTAVLWYFYQHSVATVTRNGSMRERDEHQHDEPTAYRITR